MQHARFGCIEEGGFRFRVYTQLSACANRWHHPCPRPQHKAPAPKHIEPCRETVFCHPETLRSKSLCTLYCIHTNIHTYIHPCFHAYIRTSTHLCIFWSIHTSTHPSTHTCMHLFLKLVYACIHSCAMLLHVLVWTHSYTFTFSYAFTYPYTYTYTYQYSYAQTCLHLQLRLRRHTPTPAHTSTKRSLHRFMYIYNKSYDYVSTGQHSTIPTCPQTRYFTFAELSWRHILWNPITLESLAPNLQAYNPSHAKAEKL